MLTAFTRLMVRDRNRLSVRPRVSVWFRTTVRFIFAYEKGRAFCFGLVPMLQFWEGTCGVAAADYPSTAHHTPPTLSLKTEADCLPAHPQWLLGNLKASSKTHPSLLSASSCAFLNIGATEGTKGQGYAL